MEFVKVVIDLKNSLISDIQARVISKPEILRRNGGGRGAGGGGAGVVLSKREPPVQNGRVGTDEVVKSSVHSHNE